ncbi:DUF4393 domain-containing protein [Paenibacillus sp. FSL R5-0636]|uniref:DUF4393 domain-containing protein n=1 Tax=Paenibacillus TaxID=44249 RepID=UPI00096C290B|nr:DUF4393 domain-containing protein [Paenibacillus odorifer]OMD03461.1 hypothetical protein BJP49_01210 [Paenibacillus odorifer]
MAVDKFLSDLTNSLKVPADITKAALEPAAKQIGQGLGDLFYIAFSPIAKAKIKKETEILKFKEEIEEELIKIPLEQFIEPQLSIVGPALEASKYYIEDDNLRSMFAKLIAASANAEKNDMAHTAFVEIIKQLSPLDAENFSFLVQNKGRIGIADIMLNLPLGNGANTWIKNFLPFPDINYNNYKFYSATIDNMERLGLIEIDNITTFLDTTLYESLQLHPLYKTCEEIREKSPNEQRTLGLQEKFWSVTQFGENFSACCL